MAKTKVVIFVRGGVVEEVLADKSGVECIILDRDVEGSEDYQDVRYNHETIQVRARCYEAEKKQITVEALFNQVAV